ncbi:MAG: hypothetical protein WBR26_25540, partial [Candidatus Acidiferrum sp.]
MKKTHGDRIPSGRPVDFGSTPGKSGISNEVGRCKRFFLECWPAAGTPVTYLLKSAVRSRFVCSPV